MASNFVYEYTYRRLKYIMFTMLKFLLPSFYLFPFFPSLTPVLWQNVGQGSKLGQVGGVGGWSKHRSLGQIIVPCIEQCQQFALKSTPPAPQGHLTRNLAGSFRAGWPHTLENRENGEKNFPAGKNQGI